MWIIVLAVSVGMLIVVPAGLRLVDDRVTHTVARYWQLGAVPGAVSLWLPRGPVAALLATAYAVVTLLAAGRAPARLLRSRLSSLDVAVAAALTAPAVAATALVAERAGYPLFGFKLTILALTVAHFHFAGFAAALIAGLVARTTGDPTTRRAAALSVPAGTALVFVGYFTGEYVELAGAVLLTAGMWLVGRLTWRQARGAVDRVTRALLSVSAVVLAGTMVLALSWALGEATGLPHPPLAWMAATHGVANAFGFALCGTLAWRRLRTAPL